MLRFLNSIFPVGKKSRKTIWHCIFSARLTKKALLQTVFLVILPTGMFLIIVSIMVLTR